jgi:hypothetical protein
MILMNMIVWSFGSGFKRTSESHSTWRLGSEDGSAIIFPPDERMAELWRSTVKDGGELTVITNSDEGRTNHCGVQILKGIKPTQRQPFLDALSKEVTAK